MGEVWLADDQEDHGAEGGEPIIVTRHARGGLGRAVHGSGSAVGLLRRCPGDDTPHMSADKPGDFLHGFYLRAHDVRASVDEYAVHGIDLLTLADVA